MNNDRELLELAARAAGIELYWGQRFFGLPESAYVNDNLWNPLVNDGDAFRLSVKLGMEVYVDTHPDGCACSEAKSITFGAKNMASIVNHDSDPYAATRRAITRAAAEIGKAMG